MGLQWPRRSIALIAGAIILFGAFTAACGSDTPEGAVHRVEADGEIDPIMERFLDRAISRGESSKARLVVIELNTPGGYSDSMRAIVQRMERATVPIAVYVSPAGGRAASAGTFITMAANIAAMAPNTSIGAASAINSDGTDIGGTLGTKIENDAVAFIRGIAELRGRNADWAESAVRDAVAVTQTEAVQLRVVDFVANDFDDLLRQAEGRTVELRPGTSATLTGLTTAKVIDTKMNFWEHILDFISNPTVASLLITIGFFGILIEMTSPGLVAPGVIGLLAMVVGFLGYGILPVDSVGLALIGVGLILLLLEIFLPGGILGVGGIVALGAGAIIAFRDAPADVRPPWWIVVVLGFALVGWFGSIAMTVARVRKMTIATGTSALVGKLAVARTPLTPDGFVFIQGERWKAQLDGGTASPGDRVRIVGADGLRLRVRKEEDAP